MHKKTKITFLILLGSLLISFFQISQIEQSKVKMQIPSEIFRGLGGLWILFLVIAFVSIITAIIIKNRFILFLGAAFLLFSILVIEASIILPLIVKKAIVYEECKTLFRPDVSIFTAPGLFYAFSCVLTGYATPELEWLTITTFFIFGIIAPLALLIPLFWDFMPEEIIKDPNARRVIAVVAALFAYRGFFATFFIEMLSYGFAGIGALLIGVLFTGWVWKAAYRFITPLGISVAERLKHLKLAEAEWIRREITRLEEAHTAAIAEGKTEEAKELAERKGRLEEELKRKDKGKS